MALDSFVGSFALGTGAATTKVEVTGVGFTPKLLIFWWTGQDSATDDVAGGQTRPGFGWTDGTTSRASVSAFFEDNSSSGDADRQTESAQCICALGNSRNNEGKADLFSFDNNGFTIVIDVQFGAAHQISFLALAGADLTNSDIGNFQHSGSAGNQEVTGVGFTPDVVFLMSSFQPVTDGVGAQGFHDLGVFSAAAEFCMSATMTNNPSPTKTGSYLFVGECFAHVPTPVGSPNNRASFVSMDDNGFTINWDESDTSTNFIHYLAIKGPAVAIGSVTTRTDTNDIVKTGFGFSPDAAMFFSHGLAESTLDTEQDGAMICVGGFSATDERSAQCAYSRNGVSTSQATKGIEHDAIYMRVDDSDALDAAMDIKTIGLDGFTLVMDNTDSGAHAVGYIAFGVVAGGGINTSGTLNYRRRRRMAT